MIEAVMLWNEPNNLSHWNFELDPDWGIFANMVNLAASATLLLPCSFVQVAFSIYLTRA